MSGFSLGDPDDADVSSQLYGVFDDTYVDNDNEHTEIWCQFMTMAAITDNNRGVRFSTQMLTNKPCEEQPCSSTYRKSLVCQEGNLREERLFNENVYVYAATLALGATHYILTSLSHTAYVTKLQIYLKFSHLVHLTTSPTAASQTDISSKFHVEN